ncbi:MAG TPA: acyltransferase family protein [Anaerolineales bacterium]|nr:acyltransferase family protein [Anaerolineales bacterium]
MKTQIVYPQSEAVITREKAAAKVQPKAATRLLFIDNIRVYLTILVILHHLMITYAGTGSWIYFEDRADLLTEVVGSIFTTVNQIYFMGLFLLISAYFVPGSYERKGAGRFLKDRLVRLGIPLAIYSWIIHPLLVYVYLRVVAGIRQPFWEYFPRQYFGEGYLIGQGPLWFVETLLILTLVYVAVRLLFRSCPAEPISDRAFPGGAAISLFAVLVALVTFVLRLWIPEGWNFKPLNLQFPYFPGYIALFLVGLVAYRRNWFLTLSEKTGRRWLWGCALILLIGYPVAIILGGAMENDSVFLGGWHWQALFWAFMSSFLAVGLCIGVLYLFRRYANRQGRLSRFLVPNAYTAYIIHAPVIVAVALALRGLDFHPLLKFALAALVSVSLCFGLSSLIRKLPYTDRVL